MPYSRTWWQRFLDSERQILRLFAAALALLLTGWLAWYFHGAKSAPKPAPPSPLTATAADRPAEIAAQLAALEAASRQPDPALRPRWLEENLADRKARLSSLPADRLPAEQAVLAWLEDELRPLRAAAAATASLAASQRAAAAGQAGDDEASLAAHREALLLQREANRLRPQNDPSAIEREASLARTVAQAEAQPAEREIHELLRVAETATDPTEAQSALASALQRQRTLGPPPADSADRIRRIEAKIASALSARLHAGTLAAEREADLAVAAGETDRAADAYAHAARLQQAINDQYPSSEHADFSRVPDLELRRETALATPLLGRAESLDQSAAAALRAGDIPAALRDVQEASACLDRARTDFPRASARLDPLRARLDFIWLRRSDLSALQTHLSRSTVLLSGPGAARILAAPVTQQWYSRLMNDNPSRYADPRLPVESVTWPEAQQFCTRLSWLCGREARLPLPGEIPPASPATSAEPALAEWLQSADPTTATVFRPGPPAAEPRPDLTEKSTRSRFVTFRVVLSAPNSTGR
jgi:hypothetical protein